MTDEIEKLSDDGRARLVKQLINLCHDVEELTDCLCEDTPEFHHTCAKHKITWKIKGLIYDNGGGFYDL